MSKAQQAAIAALAYLPTQAVIGVGTGSTVNYFIEALSAKRHQIDYAVASSEATASKLKALGITVADLNTTSELMLYVDGADQVDQHLHLIKGGGGAMTREKIVATCAKKFICIAADDKFKTSLTTVATPLPIEVLPMARSYVARQLVKLGMTPVYRQGFITDNHNVILDVFNVDLLNPLKTESLLNNITGVIGHGLFVTRCADLLLLGHDNGVREVIANA